MSKDIQIIPNSQGDVHFQIVGSADDSGIMLLQRLYVLLLSSPDGFRNNGSGNLLGFLEGANTPSDGALTSLIAISCVDALDALDAEDRARVANFTGESINGDLVFTLDFTDGTTLKGSFSNG